VTTEQQRVGDLQINQDLAYQQREWTVQRAGSPISHPLPSTNLFTLEGE
jgi:hypothetical protein